MALLHHTRLDRFYLPLQSVAARALQDPMLERAIGVIYRPDTEYASHYFSASLSEQFDAVFHLDETEVVEPLDDDARIIDRTRSARRRARGGRQCRRNSGSVACCSR